MYTVSEFVTRVATFFVEGPDPGRVVSAKVTGSFTRPLSGESFLTTDRVVVVHTFLCSSCGLMGWVALGQMVTKCDASPFVCSVSHGGCSSS